ncbi:Endothelin-converting enzyme 1 [Actinomortierella wolfii]|nr:Endothelin-converting enzyme 1 [Actinomortierella wolfii]
MRLLAVSALALSLCVLSVSAKDNSSDSAKSRGGGNGLCKTAECKAIAKSVLENMNPNADPCQDFYEFACGGFLKRAKIPEGESQVSTMQFDRSDHINRKILEADPKTLKGIDGKKLDKVSLRNLAKVQTVYKMCMNETLLESVGVKPLHDELKHLVTTVFPVRGSLLERVFANPAPGPSPSSSVNRKAFTSALAYFAKAGIPAMFELSSKQDPVNDPKSQRVTVRENGLSLPDKSFYTMPELVKVFQGLVQESFTIVLGKKRAVDAAELAQQVVSFETQLADISTSALEMSDLSKLFNTRTAAQLDRLNPAIDWRSFLEMTIGNNSQSKKPIIVFTPAFHERLGKLVAQTPPATLQSFFAWKVIMAQGARLSAKYRRPLESLKAVTMGTDPTVPPPRWKTCVNTINMNMGPLIGYFYIGQAFSETDRKTMVEIIEAIKDASRKRFPKLDWLDKKTLANALRKLDAIEPLVGWSTVGPNIASPTEIEKHFASVKIKKGDYYGAIDQASRLLVSKTLERVGKKTVRQHMPVDPHIFSASYEAVSNQIVFAAAFVRPPMYRTGAPEYLNYGGIGQVAAHEITHAFDTSGRNFDYDGFLRNWWTNKTATHFNAKAQCMIDQYSKFTIFDQMSKSLQPVNGLLTVGENIADNGAAQQAFLAWSSRYNADRAGRKYKNPTLPGLEKWTREQLFFVGFGQVLCTKMTPLFEQQALATDNHAPPRWRVNGPVLNMPEFAKAFKCKRGSPMNPAKRCEVW